MGEGSENLSVKGIIELALRGKGAIEAKAQMESLADAANKTATQLGGATAAGRTADRQLERTSEFSRRASKAFNLSSIAVSQLKGILLSTFGAGVVVGFVADNVRELMRFHKEVGSLTGALRGLGVAGGRSFSQIYQDVRAIEATAGVARGSAIPAIRELAAVTHDYRLSLAGAAYAASLFTDGIATDQSDALKIVAGLFKGDVTPAVAAFGINLRNANGELKTHVELAREVIELRDKARTQVVQELVPSGIGNQEIVREVQRHRARTREEMLADSEFLRQARLQDLEDLKRHTEKVAAMTGQADRELLERRIAAEREGSRARLALQIELLEMVHARAVEAFRKEKADTTSLDAAMLVERKRLVREHTQYVRAQAEKRAQIMSDFAASEQERMRKETADVLRQIEERARGAAEIQRKAYEGARAVVDQILDSERQLLELRLASLREGTREHALTQEMILDMEEARIWRTIKNEAALNAALKVLAAQRATTERQSAKATLAIEDEVYLSRVKGVTLWANAVATAHQALFGQNKALAIATAMINTFEAATVTLKDQTIQPYWLRIAMVAATIAQGLAQVQAIRKQRIGSGGSREQGFDTPGNDDMAEHAGSRWAEDWVRLTTDGFGNRLEQLLGAFKSGPAKAPEMMAMAGASGASGRQTVNYYGPTFVGFSGPRQVRRTIERAERFDRARRVR